MRHAAGAGLPGLRPLAALLAGAFAAPWTVQPNPPPWPASVRVFGPEESPAAIEAAVNEAFRQNGGRRPTNHGEFSDARFAFLFKPGKYKANVPVGYYTQVLGLGKSPDEVIFESSKGIYCEESNNQTIFGSLATFWRGAENFRMRGDMLWATSQATPVRRAIIDGNLELAEYARGIGEGYSSGGFVGNVRVGGKMKAGSQQQYFTRNAELASGSEGGVWNMVFVGTMGAPPSSCGRQGSGPATVTVHETPRIAEKPFISIGEDGKYQLHIPRLAEHRVGPDFSWGKLVPFERVFVARATDTGRAINRKLREGLHVVLTPGIYNLEVPLHVGRDNQVLLGIGFPTLIAPPGMPAVRVGNTEGARVAGLLLQAGPGSRESLLQWGHHSYQGNPRNPGVMHDIFARVGGPTDQAVEQVAARIMVRVNSGNVVGDNLWLWRADHGVGGLVKNMENPCETGLMVDGSRVTMYGLAVEHTLKDMVQWSGNAGETYFYQSEYPYDVTQAYADAGYVSYRVNKTVETHRAYGVGVYHYFRDYPVRIESGISVPPWLTNSFESPLGVYLNGLGEMKHIINRRGASSTGKHGSARAVWSCEKGPHVDYVPPPTTETSTTTATLTATTTTATATTVTCTGSPTATTTTTTTATSTATTSRTSTTTTGTSTSTTTSTSTMTQTLTTTTTTTTVLMWWEAIAGEVPHGLLPWVAMILPLNFCLVCGVIVCGCCRRRRASDENQVPLSRLLSILGSPRRGSALSPMSNRWESSRLFDMGTPKDGLVTHSPGSHRHGGAARTISVERNTLASALRGRSSSLLDLHGHSPRRGSESPMRQNMARMFSVMSVAESVFTLSPRAAPSPWVRRHHEDSEV
uniref:Pectate lyase superfamily protein domain-containing protein n=1 Tax=Alexandrium monilatum TaxID=311494 RepID=A0A7S4SB81_9DINO